MRLDAIVKAENEKEDPEVIKQKKLEELEKMQ